MKRRAWMRSLRVPPPPRPRSFPGSSPTQPASCSTACTSRPRRDLAAWKSRRSLMSSPRPGGKLGWRVAPWSLRAHARCMLVSSPNRSSRRQQQRKPFRQHGMRGSAHTRRNGGRCWPQAAAMPPRTSAQPASTRSPPMASYASAMESSHSRCLRG